MEVFVVTVTDPANSSDAATRRQEAVLIGKYDKRIVYNDPLGNSTTLIKSSPVVMSGSNTNIDAPITAYIANEITFQSVSASDAGTAPTPGLNGVLVTYRFSPDAFSYQEWKQSKATNKFIRNWNDGTSTWGEWGQ